MLVPILAPSNNRRAGRRIFWSGFLLAAVSAFFIAYPPDWKSGTVWSLLACFLMIFTAYSYTPYIKIRGKIYAFYVKDSQPDPTPDGPPPPGSDDQKDDPAPDSYSGLLTASKTWWSLVFAMIICVVIIDTTKPWHDALSAGILLVFATVAGFGDASWGYPVARGQRLQFVIISLITACVFTVVYFAAYQSGKRWPLRRKQSMEYRAHPRHQKRHPS